MGYDILLITRLTPLEVLVLSRQGTIAPPYNFFAYLLYKLRYRRTYCPHLMREENSFWFSDLASLLKKVPNIIVFCVPSSQGIEELFHDSNLELQGYMVC